MRPETETWEIFRENGTATPSAIALDLHEIHLQQAILWEVITKHSIPLANMLAHPDSLPFKEAVHPLIRNLFQSSEVRSAEAGRVQKFLENWKLITNDQNILNIVKNVVIRISDSISHPSWGKNAVEEKVIDLEVRSMLRKGAIRVAIRKPD